ncbi:MAG: S-adenosylmethionine decarboxylase [Deltaproteobacteria bacterium]|nr:S-adenosylmethionine decarboxylase [Deltaproteobacteria bacterium]
MTVGQEWLVDAIGCAPERLCDLNTLQQVCERIITELDLHVIGESVWHQFPSPGGITGIYLLTESHLTCHTYPETGIVTFNLYCCRPRPEWRWVEELTATFAARQVTARTFMRGVTD